MKTAETDSAYAEAAAHVQAVYAKSGVQAAYGGPLNSSGYYPNTASWNMPNPVPEPVSSEDWFNNRITQLRKMYEVVSATSNSSVAQRIGQQIEDLVRDRLKEMSGLYNSTSNYPYAVTNVDDARRLRMRATLHRYESAAVDGGFIKIQSSQIRSR